MSSSYERLVLDLIEQVEIAIMDNLTPEYVKLADPAFNAIDYMYPYGEGI
jgi:hypothetical protein